MRYLTDENLKQTNRFVARRRSSIPHLPSSAVAAATQELTTADATKPIVAESLDAEKLCSVRSRREPR